MQESISEKELTKARHARADLGLFLWDVNLAEHSFYASWRRCNSPARTFIDSQYTRTAELLALLEPVWCKVTTRFMFSIFFFCLNTSWSNVLPPYLFPFFHNLKVLKGSTWFLLSALHFLKTEVGLLYFLYASPLTVDALDVRSELQLLRPGIAGICYLFFPKRKLYTWCFVMFWTHEIKACKTTLQQFVAIVRYSVPPGMLCPKKTFEYRAELVLGAWPCDSEAWKLVQVWDGPLDFDHKLKLNS